MKCHGTTRGRNGREKHECGHRGHRAGGHGPRILARNMESKGYTVAVYTRSAEKTRESTEGPGKGGKFIAAEALPQFVASLSRPRKIMIMVKARKPVDEMIDQALFCSWKRGTSSSTGATPGSPIRYGARRRWRRRESFTWRRRPPGRRAR